ncbi:MAG: beta-lactamase regulator AmpE [Plesiomonas sp.]|uniref:beta-lactamase regulator AmpE n=1 Tax=Plesiomonas sp. TaxID=2486279 RepID=UPI003F3D0F2D
MKLFSLLLILAWERLFKTGEHWQIDHWLHPLWGKIARPSLIKSTLLWLVSVLLISAGLLLVKGHVFGLVSLVCWIALGLLCIGAGYKRMRYRAYLVAARRGETENALALAENIARIHGLPCGGGDAARLQALQSALLWTHFRYYIAPAFWFVVGGPAIMVGYAVLRAYQSWLAEQNIPQRAESGVDTLLGWLDWLPIRICSLAYVFAGKGDKALPMWAVAVADLHASAYQILGKVTRLALLPQDSDSWVDMPQAAVTLARKSALLLVVVVSVLTIYGLLV